MPSGQPTAQDAHVDRILTEISVAYMQSTSEFIASQVFPLIPSARQSDKYFKYNKDDWFREEAQLRAPGAESAGSGYELSTDSYYCDVFAVHKDIDAQLRANADDVFNLDAEATEWVSRQLLMKLESVFVRDFFKASLWTGSASAADQTGVTSSATTDQFIRWDQVDSDPIKDIETLIDEMQEKTGYRANTLVWGPKVGAAMRRHPDIMDRIKYTQRGVITNDLIGSLLGLRILEARATRNTAHEGATDAYSFYYGKNAMLCYSAPNPGRMQASAGYVFGWSGYTGSTGTSGIGVGARTSVIPMPHLRSDRVEGEMAVEMKAVATDLGIYFASCTS